MANITRINGYQDELVAIRHDLHAHPETGFEERSHLGHRRQAA